MHHFGPREGGSDATLPLSVRFITKPLFAERIEGHGWVKEQGAFTPALINPFKRLVAFLPCSSRFAVFQLIGIHAHERLRVLHGVHAKQVMDVMHDSNCFNKSTYT